MLAPVAEHAATEAAVADSWRALRDATPADLHALGGRGRRQADVVRLTADVGCRLAGSYDTRDAATAAVEALGRDASLVAGTGPVVVHLPAGLPPHHLTLLRALGAVTTVVVQVGVTGDPSVDAEAHDLVRDLGATCTGIELLAAPGATAAVAAPDADTEVLAALRDVAARVAAGTPLDRIAIAYGPASPYAVLLHERCAAAGLPVVGPATRTLAQTLAGRALLGALDLHASAWRARRRRGLVGHGPAPAPGSRGRRRRGRPAVAPGRRHAWPRALAERPGRVGRRARPPPRGAAVRRGPGRRGPRPTGGPRP